VFCVIAVREQDGAREICVVCGVAGAPVEWAAADDVA
jgi:hypothetical protein